MLEASNGEFGWKKQETNGEMPPAKSMDAVVLVDTSLVCFMNVDKSIQVYSLDTSM